MRVSLILALIGSLTGSALPATATATASTVASPDAKSLASKLVELTFPTEMIRRDASKSYATNFRASFLRNPQAEAAVQRMPGLLDAIVKAGSSKLDQIIMALLPTLESSTAASYASSLTVSELEQAVTFYSSSAGKKLVAATPAVAAGGDVRKILSPAELSDFAAFSRSSAGQKIGALKPQQTNDISVAVNHALGSAQPQIDAAAMAAGQSYMRAHQPKRR